ncbi:MAG: phage tail assembly chaperone [Methylobacteriaceae bacterium]|nr:phage tail assembly chaperone [Methylobacteriaceae bacterium]
MSARAPSPFPWDEVLHAALGRLRWSPRETWAATPREVAWALGHGVARPPALDRAGLAALIDRFPDRGGR